MSVGKALCTFVEGNALLKAKLGGDATKFRPYQNLAGEDFPYAEYILLDETIERVSEGMTDAVDALVQIDIYSKDYPEASILQDAFFQELCRSSVLAGRSAFRGSIDGIFIVSCWRSGIAEGDDAPQVGQSVAPYRLSQDFEIGYYLNTDPIT